MDIATLIAKERTAILARWEEIAAETVPAAQSSSRLALRDHLPMLIDDIERALALLPELGDGREAGTRAFSKASSAQHGRQRASTEGYTADQVIHEYVLLRYVFVDTIFKAGLWDHQSIEAITRVLECGALYSVTEFVKSIEEVQQRLLGSLAHDIRTPLSVARMALGMTKTKATDPEYGDPEEIKQIALQGVNRALDLLEGLLDTIVAQAGDGLVLTFEDGDFGHEIAGACAEAKTIYGERRIIVGELGSIHGCFDLATVRRVFENLMSNAVRHGSPRLPIRVELVDEGESVVLSVTNQGPPIPESKREEIFEFLARGEQGNGDGGTRNWGIGLSYVKLAAEGHKGSVWLTSDAENGTTFSVRLRKFARQPGRIRTRLLRG